MTKRDKKPPLLWGKRLAHIEPVVFFSHKIAVEKVLEAVRLRPQRSRDGVTGRLLGSIDEEEAILRFVENYGFLGVCADFPLNEDL